MNRHKDFDSQARLRRQFDEIREDTQRLLRESEDVRAELWSKADRASRDVEKWKASTVPYRRHFYDDVIGRFDRELRPPNVRSRQVYDETLYTGYEVVLDVFPDVMAYGILLLPRNIKQGERRPVVVCQHGLEGRPTDVADPKKFNPSYNQYACRLAERGFIVYAPQNPYIFQDRFRTLQRKANPLGKTLYSIIVPQHQQLVDWLATLPQVDRERIALLWTFVRRQDGDARAGPGRGLLPVDLLGRFQRVDLEERLDALAVQLRGHRRVRDLRVRPGQHLQLCRNGRP